MKYEIWHVKNILTRSVIFGGFGWGNHCTSYLKNALLTIYTHTCVICALTASQTFTWLASILLTDKKTKTKKKLLTTSISEMIYALQQFFLCSTLYDMMSHYHHTKVFVPAVHSLFLLPVTKQVVQFTHYLLMCLQGSALFMYLRS